MFQSLCGFLFLKRIFFFLIVLGYKDENKESGTWFELKWLKHRKDNARYLEYPGKFLTLSHPSLPWIIVNEKASVVFRSNFRTFCLLCLMALPATVLIRILKELYQIQASRDHSVIRQCVKSTISKFTCIIYM